MDSYIPGSTKTTDAATTGNELSVARPLSARLRATGALCCPALACTRGTRSTPPGARTGGGRPAPRVPRATVAVTHRRAAARLPGPRRLSPAGRMPARGSTGGAARAARRTAASADRSGTGAQRQRAVQGGRGGVDACDATPVQPSALNRADPRPACRPLPIHATARRRGPRTRETGDINRMPRGDRPPLRH